ncbi:hypothetical protein F4820DRAFT_471569 [Hypoxylon rubiginosum]|uniref:Uncharacterized protein n=1 Tax=Hypoxylon rubiginosum TaxID=110542 RepID=A0ACB9YVZ0_9PEZI|nr:hypothetical protein F4820DRAFT_471569 [Hypoxylon rubiginosum]
MAFQGELQLKLAQTSSLTANLKPKNEQIYQQEWLQLITSQAPQAIDPNKNIYYTKQESPPLPTSNDIRNTDHASQVQWFACQLSKKTLRQYLDRTAMPLPLPTGGARLEILPQDVLDRICRHVPYEDLLRLYQQSRALHRRVDPHLAPYPTKLSLVLRAERDFRKHHARGAAPPNLGCYMCHRVLPPGLFAIRQARQALVVVRPPVAVAVAGHRHQTVVNLRRFCVPCGVRTGCHGRGETLVTQTGAQYWLCECPRVHPEQAPGCGGCRMFCPIVVRRADEAGAARDATYRIWELMKTARSDDEASSISSPTRHPCL